MYNVVNTLAPSFLIGSSSFSQVTRAHIQSRVCSKFGQIQPWTVELAAFPQLKKSFTYLRKFLMVFMTWCYLFVCWGWAAGSFILHFLLIIRCFGAFKLVILFFAEYTVYKTLKFLILIEFYIQMVKTIAISLAAHITITRLCNILHFCTSVKTIIFR